MKKLEIGTKLKKDGIVYKVKSTCLSSEGYSYELVIDGKLEINESQLDEFEVE